MGGATLAELRVLGLNQLSRLSQLSFRMQLRKFRKSLQDIQREKSSYRKVLVRSKAQSDDREERHPSSWQFKDRNVENGNQERLWEPRFKVEKRCWLREVHLQLPWNACSEN